MANDTPDDVLKFHPDDVFIVVTGITGHGKSSFISKCCEGFDNIVGHSLKSHTQKCNIYAFKHKEKTVRLVDTPGFDDSKRTGTEVLREIAEWLVWGHKQGMRLSGIVYLHSISLNRMGGTGITNLEMFKRITGMNNMNHVVLATTMWDKTPKEDAQRRESELWSDEDFWAPLIHESKSMPARFMNNKTSALSIIDKVIALETFVPSLQHEMAVENMELNQTAAGKTLNKEILEAQETSQREMKQMEEHLQQALQEKDLKYAQTVMDMQTDLSKKMEQLAQNQKDMQVRSDELLKKKEEEIQKAREEMESMREKVQQQDQKHAAAVEQMRDENKRREEQSNKMMTDLAKRAQDDMETYKEKLVSDAVVFISAMKDAYEDVVNEQQKSTEEKLAKLKAQTATSPPPYSPTAPPIPVYYPPPPQAYYPNQRAQEDMMAGAAGGIALGGAAAAVASLGACSVM